MRFLCTFLILVLSALVQSTAYATQAESSGMMGDANMMGGWMMAACMLFGLLLLIALVLSIFALIKYLRSGRSHKP